MGVLNFCEHCSVLRIRDVKKELEKLVLTKYLSPDQCGICQNPLPTKSLSSLTQNRDLNDSSSDIPQTSEKVGSSEPDHETATPKPEQQQGTENDGEVADVKPSSKTAESLHVTRLTTGKITHQHFEGLDLGEDNDSVDVPFDILAESQDCTTNTDKCKSNAGKKRKVKKNLTPQALEKKKKKKTTKPHGKKRVSKSCDSYNTKLTEAQVAFRNALDPKLLCMIDTEGTPTKAIKCKECKMAFFKIHGFIKHVSSHTGEELSITKPYVCQVCSYRIPNVTALERHMASHSKEKPYVCHWDGCSAHFACQRYLTKHIRRHEGHKSYIMRYPRPHSNVTTKYRKYKCPLCEYKAKTKDALSIHQNTHTNARPFKCSYCDRCFNDPSSKRSHEGNKHSNSKDSHYMCELCGYSSFFRADLIKHQRIHTGDKPYGCDQCDYRCNRRDNLRKHLRIHSGDKLYKCVGCELAFHSLKTCRNHEKTHSQPKPQEKSDSQTDKSFPQNEKYFSQTENKEIPIGDSQENDKSRPNKSDAQETSRPYPISVLPVIDPSQGQPQSQSQSEEWIRAVNLLQHLQQM